MPQDLRQFARREFGLAGAALALPPPAGLDCPRPGEIHALVGPSGCGKTRALRALARRCPDAHLVRPCNTRQAARPVADLFDGVDGAAAFDALAACGLADGRLWATRVRDLSEGERARLWLAVAMGRGHRLLLADEFDGRLDWLGACALAENLARIVSQRGIALLVTTHRPEVLAHLGPSRVLQLGDGLAELAPPAPARLCAGLAISPGTLADWAHFARWHYLGHGRPGPVAAVYVAWLDGRRAGIAVYGFPHLLLSARRHALPAPAHARNVLAHGAGWLNANVRLLSRVVVDPQLRGCGVAADLLRRTLPLLGVPFVECLAQMGRHSSFLRAAGLSHMGAVRPPAAAARLVALAQRLGVDTQELADPLRREQLLAQHPALRAPVRALAVSRIESGHGSLRRRGADAGGLVSRALARLHARPAYFVWRAP